MLIKMALISALLLTTMSLWAAQMEQLVEQPSAGLKENFHRHLNVSDTQLSLVTQKVTELLESGVGADKIACVFDVDGTLTDEADPEMAEGIYPRSREIIDFVRSMHTMGVTMVASSAWDYFRETVSKVKALCLMDVFSANEKEELTKKE